NLVLFHHAAFAFALATGIGNYASLTMASWAWPGNAEHCLLIADLSATGARLTCGWSLGSRRTCAVALLTRFIPAYLGLSLLAESSFLKSQGDVGTCVTTALHAGASSATAAYIHAKEIAEQVAKNVADI